MSDLFGYPRAVVKAANEARSKIQTDLKKTNDKSEIKALKKRDKDAKREIKKQTTKLKQLNRRYKKTKDELQDLNDELALVKQEMRKLKCR